METPLIEYVWLLSCCYAYASPEIDSFNKAVLTKMIMSCAKSIQDGKLGFEGNLLKDATLEATVKPVSRFEIYKCI